MKNENAVILLEAPPIPHFAWEDIVRASTSLARSRLSYEHALSLCVLPLRYIEDQSHGILTVLLAEPYNASIAQEIRFLVDCEIAFDCVPRATLFRAIHAAYCGDEQSLVHAAERATAIHQAENGGKTRFCSWQSAEPIPQLLDSILNRALTLRSSDVHLEPGAESYRVRFRIDGRLQIDSNLVLPPEIGVALVRRIKVLSQLDTTQQFAPQEGGFSHLAAAIEVRLRVSVVNQSYGEKVVLRLLDDGCFLSEDSEGMLSGLGLNMEKERFLRGCLAAESGTILLSGPTGSGKSTLLYAMLRHLNEEWRNIITIEDPVERRILGVNQTEVRRDLGLDYQQLLGPLLRQDPDVMMIGEIRDQKTAQMALTAGITGHLVLSTVHAGNCMEVIVRLLELGISTTLAASSLRLIISQRLIPKVCGKCMRREPANASLMTLFEFDEVTQISRETGCEDCYGSGIKGRAIAVEFLPIVDEMKQALRQGKDLSGNSSSQNDLISALQNIARQFGYRPYAYEVRQLLMQGVVSPRYALRAVSIAPELIGY